MRSSQAHKGAFAGGAESIRAEFDLKEFVDIHLFELSQYFVTFPKHFWRLHF